MHTVTVESFPPEVVSCDQRRTSALLIHFLRFGVNVNLHACLYVINNAYMPCISSYT